MPSLGAVCSLCEPPLNQRQPAQPCYFTPCHKLCCALAAVRGRDLSQLAALYCCMLCILSGQRCRQMSHCRGHTTATAPAEPLTKSAVASWTPGSPATPAESGYGRGPAVEHVALRGPRRGGVPLQTTAAAQVLEASLALEGVKGHCSGWRPNCFACGWAAGASAA